MCNGHVNICILTLDHINLSLCLAHAPYIWWTGIRFPMSLSWCQKKADACIGQNQLITNDSFYRKRFAQGQRWSIPTYLWSSVNPEKYDCSFVSGGNIQSPGCTTDDSITIYVEQCIHNNEAYLVDQLILAR